MALNPIPIALVCVIAYSMQVMVTTTGETEITESNVECDDLGGIDILGDIVECVRSIGEYVLQFLTFQVSGMPWYLGVPLGVACTGSIVWAFATLIRGN